MRFNQNVRRMRSVKFPVNIYTVVNFDQVIIYYNVSQFDFWLRCIYNVVSSESIYINPVLVTAFHLLGPYIGAINTGNVYFRSILTLPQISAGMTAAGAAEQCRFFSAASGADITKR